MELRADRAAPERPAASAIFTSAATNHGSPRHESTPQLLERWLLLVDAMSLNSKKIRTIGFRITRSSEEFLYRGGIAVSKASRRLRREAASAKKSRVFDLSVFAISASML